MQTRTEGGVDVGEKMADAVGGLEHGEHEQQHVQNCGSVDEAPEQGVRPAEYRVPEVGHSVSGVSVTCRNCGRCNAAYNKKQMEEALMPSSALAEDERSMLPKAL